MAPCARGLRALLAFFALLALVGPADARVPVVWARKRLSSTCEPPYVFYSSAHVAGHSPCCPTIEGACPGSLVCPAGGVCSDGKSCVQGPVASRPNVVLFIADDQGYCKRRRHTGNDCNYEETPVGDGPA